MGGSRRPTAALVVAMSDDHESVFSAVIPLVTGPDRYLDAYFMQTQNRSCSSSRAASRPSSNDSSQSLPSTSAATEARRLRACPARAIAIAFFSSLIFSNLST